MLSKIHLSLPKAYKQICLDRNVNGNRDVKFLECDKWSLHWYENLTLVRILQISLKIRTSGNRGNHTIREWNEILEFGPMFAN